MKIISDEQHRVILVTRSHVCLTAVKDMKKVITIFPDFSDNRCIESIYGVRHMNIAELNFLYTQSDYVFSHSYCSENAYDWEDKGHFDYLGELSNGIGVINIGRHYQPLYVGLALRLKNLLMSKLRNDVS